MPLGSTAAALAQFDANANWYGSIAAAELRLESVEYLIAHRAERVDDMGSSMTYGALTAMRSDLQKFLGAGVPRSFGLPRTSYADFCGRSGVG